MKVQTNDAQTRLQVKRQLKDKIDSTSPKSPTSEPGEIVVVVPSNFHTLSKGGIFKFLTEERALTTNQANDVIEVLSGNTLDGYKVILQGKVETINPQPQPVKVPEPRVLDITLPYNFHLLKDNEKFLWLTKQSGLSLSFEEANDIVDSFKSNPTNLSGTVFTLSFEDPPPMPERKEVPISKVAPRGKERPFAVRIPEEFHSLDDPSIYRHLILEAGLTPEVAAESIYRLRESQKEEIEPVQVSKTLPTQIDVQLPTIFKSYTTLGKYKYLTHSQFTPEQANDLVALLTDKPVTGKWVFNISYKDTPVELPPPPAPKPQVRKQIKTVESKEIPVELHTMRDDLLYRKLTADAEFAWTPEVANESIYQLRTGLHKDVQPETEVPKTKEITVSIPEAFSLLGNRDRYLYLTGVSHLSQELANDIVAILDGKQQVTETKFTLISEASPVQGENPVSRFLADQTKREVEQLKRFASFTKPEKQVKVKSPEPKPLTVVVKKTTVPVGFLSLRPTEQYVYLTRTLEWIPEHANDLVAQLSGKPTNPQVIFEVFEEE